MATDTVRSTTNAKDAQTNARMQKAKETREKNAAKHVPLDSRSKFSLNMLQQAARGCKILTEKIRCGEPVDAATLQAAATLSAVAAAAM